MAGYRCHHKTAVLLTLGLNSFSKYFNSTDRAKIDRLKNH